MFRALFLTVIFCVFCGQAWAAACYTNAEAEAEQGVRLHSELMVIGLNCQHLAHAAGNKNLYLAYREFSAAHGKLFAAYETQLLNYFKRTGVSDPEAALHKLRTDLANKISTDAAQMRPDIFCAHYAGRIDQARGMDEGAIRAQAAIPVRSLTQPACAQ